MNHVGVICEYNPFHNGHMRQLRAIREQLGQDTAVVCLMSGDWVQRGAPAIFQTHLRAEAAVRCGADLVLELPIPYVLSSAEGFAAGGVRILSELGCDRLSFGSEQGRAEPLMSAARLQLDPDFDARLREALASGVSYASARAEALRALGAPDVVSKPNDNLGVEYCKSILRQGCSMQPLVIPRAGAYHAEALDPAEPSASALRRVLVDGGQWQEAVPDRLRSLYETAERHFSSNGERAVLARLRTLSDDAFKALPFGSEGLWSRLMRFARTEATVDTVIDGTKTKRYARARIQRMVLCAFLGLTESLMQTEPPYVRILAFNDCGRSLLRQARTLLPLLDSGERAADGAYAAFEARSADLYALFSDGPVASGGALLRRRNVYIHA